MPFVAILGCDGAGKSAVLDGLTERLEARGHRVHRHHWCPKLGAEGGVNLQGADDPHGQEPWGPVASMAKLGLLWLRWWRGWFSFLRRESRDGVVLFDRFHADLLVDPRRYRYGGPIWAASGIQRLLPQPDRAIFLDAPVDVLLERKQEVPEASLEQVRSRYRDLCRSRNELQIVDASLPLAEVVDQVEGIVLSLLDPSPERS